MELQQTLRDVFGYADFRQQQREIVEHVIAGKHALVIMPTGGGKSLCYQIPALLRPGCGVVISPLIALMQDQVDALRELGIRAGFLNSTQNYEEVQQIEQQLYRGELDLLYIAPERLQQGRTFQLLQSVSVALFAIDEAHCVSQWGHDFRGDYLRLDQLAHHFPSVPRIALTATADTRTQQDISQRLSIPEASAFVSSFDRPNIFYKIEERTQAKQQLLRFIRQNHEQDSGIVYCLSRKKTEEVAAWLVNQGVNALVYHAGLTHQIRTQHQMRFLREENIVMVATIAFGMGIDKPDVRFVAHLDLPKSIEAYYQETGRAGRDGAPANAWMVYGLEDVMRLREMIGFAPADDDEKSQHKRIEHHKLAAMLGLCEATRCRRQCLLQYFDEVLAKPCGHCDTCLTPVATWDATEAAQKAMSCVYRTGQRFGVTHLIDVLMGANTEKIRQFGHEKLSVYGIGKALGKPKWRSIYRQLIAHDYLQIDFDQFNRVILTERCRPLLRGEDTLHLRQETVKSTAKRQVGQVKPQQNAFWEQLRECRTTLARERNVPPYVIFSDAVLMQMMECRPQTQAQFATLHGVGEKKCQQYAEMFLAVIQAHGEDNTEDEGSLSATVLETYSLLQQGLSPQAVAQKRELAVSTVYHHASCLIRESQLALAEVCRLDERDIDTIESAFIDHNVLDHRARLKPVYDALLEAYDYNTLRCVHAHFLKKL